MNKLTFKLLAVVTLLSLVGTYPASLLAIGANQGGISNNPSTGIRAQDNKVVAPGTAASTDVRGFDQGARQDVQGNFANPSANSNDMNKTTNDINKTNVNPDTNMKDFSKI